MSEDWLERRLRAAEDHIDDDGFTLRVMGALPAARPLRSNRSDWILLAGTAAGSAVVAAQFPLAPFLNLLAHTVQITWIAGLAALALMGGALLLEPLRKAL